MSGFLQIVRGLLPNKPRLERLPILVILPASGCNCRCLMCDYWKEKGDRLSVETLSQQIDSLKRLQVEWILLSGGEALIHPEIWELCELLKQVRPKISLLTNGLLLEKHARDAARYCDEIILSLDGPETVHDRIRGVPGGFDKLRKGVAAVRGLRHDLLISARSVIQKANFERIVDTVEAARSLGLSRISFLPVDLFSDAFNRAESLDSETGLDAEECARFKTILDDLGRSHAQDFSSGFIAENPEKLARVGQYFGAALGRDSFPRIHCNAPWVSAVLEADGAVRPCFFHPPYGNLRDGTLEQVLNSERALTFRKELKVAKNSVCQRCVCPLYLASGRPTP